ncbi:hypothetical protein HCG49_02940 [Arenibacter sp. 6A1]|uniref:hypothetical protein n=1 Tax=Arenibacter sp. 6A1 TaxID=2720391 RepID=UPI001447D749|nr:hypothetical protein [Arenibacter sp. 6A1]NKI25515.1 hypothetical protein [Arenibacter sp. 6A1]
MTQKPTFWIVVLAVVILAFGVGIYLQDIQHQKSTKAAWQANRFNITRFDKIMKYAAEMDAENWSMMRDSIGMQLDSLMILRFRKEKDSLDALKKK